MRLPNPSYKGNNSLEEVLLKRRSVREYKKLPLTISEVSQLLWACQGVTENTFKLRTSPSAGALYPLNVYLVVGEVEGLEKGVYKYNPNWHEIKLVKSGDIRDELYRFSLLQDCVRNAPISIVISADYSITTRKYGNRGIKYVHMEVGHVGENLYLQATALGLGTVAVGAFDNEKVRELLGIPDKEEVLYIMPVGRV